MKLDAGSEEQLRFIYPDIAERWRKAARAFSELHQKEIRITEGLRTFETQTRYWAKGRTKEPNGSWIISNPQLVITHARPGESMHHYGLAIDICFLGHEPYPKDRKAWVEYGAVLKSFGLTWGGDWMSAACDQPHCEDKYGFTTKEIQSFFLEHQTIVDVWDQCSQRLHLFKGNQI